MQPVKWGVLSTAKIGLEKVIPAMQKAESCDIAAIASRDLARAQEIQALANYERVQALYENNNASVSQLDAARAAYESAHEQDNIAKKRRKLTERQLGYTTLRAPRSGAISDVLIDQCGARSMACGDRSGSSLVGRAKQASGPVPARRETCSWSRTKQRYSVQPSR